MLVEQLSDLGVKVESCNTDGISIIYNKLLDQQVQSKLREWQQLSKMELECTHFTKMVRKDINNYLVICQDNGKVSYKQKGAFLTEPPVDMSHDNLVVSKALYHYYKSGIPIEQSIRGHDNIYDFCACQKVAKTYSVFWNGQRQQRLNRYFVAKRGGAYLYKSKDGENMEHMLKGYSVQLFNDYYEKPMAEYEIDYGYYIAETKKLLNQLEPQQLSMF